MKVTIITFCLIGVVFANPISYNAILESSEHDANSTESLSVSQSSSAENNTSELQSSEENTSNQSSESESLESTSEDKTSEESDSQSDEDDGPDSMTETRDNSMGSEENIRKSWVRVISSVVSSLSAEDNSSTEVKGQTEQLSKELIKTNVTQGQTNLQLVDAPIINSDSTSNSADTSDIIDVVATTSDSNSSESNSSESNETSEASESSEDSKSTEDSNASDSNELLQIKGQDCVNGTQSCESEEYFFQDIGDDGHHSDNLMVPDDDERELSLRR